MPTSELIDYLPAIFQENPDLDQFLLAFERILLGRTNLLDNPPDSDLANYPGLEETISGLAKYFDPHELIDSREKFLPWLSSWVALTLRNDWSPDERRRFISGVVPSYRQRGTKAGLIGVLLNYSGIPEAEAEAEAEDVQSVEVQEFEQRFTVGRDLRVGVNTVVGEAPPHYFVVRILLPVSDQNRDRREQIVRAIIDQEKPAHTYYDLIIEYPTMIVGVFDRCRVGISTVLGRPSS